MKHTIITNKAQEIQKTLKDLTNEIDKLKNLIEPANRSVTNSSTLQKLSPIQTSTT